MRLRRALAATLTALLAGGIVAAPAFGVESEDSVETTICESAGPQRQQAADDLAAGVEQFPVLNGTLISTRDDLEATSVTLGATGLAYLKALDGSGNVSATEAAYTAAAAQFAEDLVEFIDAAAAHRDALKMAGLNSALYNYLAEVCPPPA